MKHKTLLSVTKISLISTCLLFSSGCSTSSNQVNDTISVSQTAETYSTISPSKEQVESTAPLTEESSELEIHTPTVIEVDWSNYFDGINGAAVFYDTSLEQYKIYNQSLADIQRSPCSTFKIISSLVGLEKGIIDPENSIHKWSGENFWNENWNKDIDFKEAFQTSCVWYYREVIDQIGPDIMQTELDKLNYGNKNISDWNGNENTNNNNPALTGFWIESSLKISAKEQVKVMEKIFGNNTTYKSETIQQLKQVMLVTDYSDQDFSIYGKTGMGKLAGIVVDSWFTGFVNSPKGNIYFCVYLGETKDKEVSSQKAKDIAIQIARDHYCTSGNK